MKVLRAQWRRRALKAEPDDDQAEAGGVCTLTGEGEPRRAITSNP
jgi:hypothetical protein